MRNYLTISLSMMLVIFISSCKKNDEQNVTAPKLTTIEISDITYKSAKSGGTIVSDGGSSIVTQGVCWSKNENPTILDSYTVDDTTQSFNSYLTGLDDETTYYVRSYATNETETGYGNQISFTTLKKITSSFSAVVDGIPYNPTKLTKSTMSGIIQISALNGSQNMIIRIPEDFTTGSHDVSMTDYSIQYFPGNGQIFTSTSGSGSINILEFDDQTSRIKVSFHCVGTDPNSSATVSITNGQLETTIN